MKKIVFTILLLVNSISIAQTNTKEMITKTSKSSSKLKILGTSTLHDWESTAKKIDAAITFNESDLLDIDSLKLKVNIFGISSGKRKMDRDTHKALNGNSYPNIIFKLFKSSTLKNEKNNVLLNGEVEVAGVKKTINVKAIINQKKDTIFLKGSHKLKMTTFGIEPPSALLGIIKTGDEVTIDFKLKF